jgi:hypothetical protein
MPISGGNKESNPLYRRPRRDSNSQPSDPKSGALSIELLGRRDYYTVLFMQGSPTSTSPRTSAACRALPREKHPGWRWLPGRYDRH